jgi:hypothetical protein
MKTFYCVSIAAGLRLISFGGLSRWQGLEQAGKHSLASAATEVASMRFFK